MRKIKLTGREATVVRALGFSEAKLGSELLDFTRMESDDMTDTLNGLISVGFLECVPLVEQIGMAEMPATSFEINPSYSHELKSALIRY